MIFFYYLVLCSARKKLASSVSLVSIFSYTQPVWQKTAKYIPPSPPRVSIYFINILIYFSPATSYPCRIKNISLSYSIYFSALSINDESASNRLLQLDLLLARWITWLLSIRNVRYRRPTIYRLSLEFSAWYGIVSPWSTIEVEKSWRQDCFEDIWVHYC